MASRVPQITIGAVALTTGEVIAVAAAPVGVAVEAGAPFRIISTPSQRPANLARQPNLQSIVRTGI